MVANQERVKLYRCGLVRIMSPYFVVGVEIRKTISGDRFNNRCPPIVKYMRKWDVTKIIDYCKLKKWKYDFGPDTLILDGGKK